MATVRCPSCSAPVRSESRTCPQCGTALGLTVAVGEAKVRYAERAPRLLFPPGHVFAGRFTIIEKVGEGGMGVVYKAIDTILQGEVALKLIQPGLARMPDFAQRFRREVRLTRQITHSNVCRVHDIGEVDGILYLSMEWIEGETLQQLLQQTGRLKESRALEIAEKIALALGAAHEEGIIHRDLKPGNVMIDARGHVHVMDFGLAVEHGGGDITEAGVLVGSPYYMAPEQRRLQEIDHRADFYSLGLILREMLLGVRLDPSPGLPTGVRSALGPVILPVLERLLAEKKEDRYGSALQASRAIHDLLKDPAISTVTPHAETRPAVRVFRPGLILSMGAAALALATLWIVLRPSPSSRPSPHRLDVGAAGFYERGVQLLREAETMRTVDAAIQMFNRALDSDRNSALVLARLGEAYWFRYTFTEDEEARRASRDEAHRAVDRAVQIDPSLPEALYARGLGFVVERDSQAAKADLEKVVGAKPDFAMAWVMLGVVHRRLGDYAAALEAYRKALELEPGNYMVHLYLGHFHEEFREHDPALKEYRIAGDLRPDSSMAWNNVGATLLRTGRFAEAIAAFEHVLKIEDGAKARTNLGTAYYFLGRYEEAVAQYGRATELEPRSAVNWGNLGDGLLALGKPDEAREVYLKAAAIARERVALQPPNREAEARQDLALYCAKAWDEECALKEGEAAAKLDSGNAAILLVNAIIRCKFGRDADGLDWLDKAVKHGTTRAEIEAAPELKRLRSDTRFIEILALAP